MYIVLHWCAHGNKEKERNIKIYCKDLACKQNAQKANVLCSIINALNIPHDSLITFSQNVKLIYL